MMMTMMMKQSQVANVRREELTACMTCRLCNNIFVHATTISECLHTFCKKCIHEKITEEDLNCCPVCNTYLGGSPLDKLRPDHSWEGLRAKFFPPDKQNDKKLRAKAVPSVPLPPRRKERSQSCVTVATPRVSARAGPPTKGIYALKINHPQIFSSPEPLVKIPPKKRQSSSKATSSKQHMPASSKQHMPNKATEGNSKALEQETDVWESLNNLADAAVSIKSKNLNIPDTVANVSLPNPPENEAHPVRTNVKGKDRDDSSLISALLSSETASRRQDNRHRKAAVSEDLNVPVQPVANENGKTDRQSSPVWFSLVASSDQTGNAPLPQLSSSYLRVKDDSMPVSYIQKYLMKKLDLASESEVEILLLGQPVIPALQLHSLRELWLRAAPKPENLQISAGSSAKDFVMVIYYRRKAQYSQNSTINLL